MQAITCVEAFTKYLLKQDFEQEKVMEIQRKLKFYCKGVLFRSKRVYDRINEIP
jgi:hypothetical protein